MGIDFNIKFNTKIKINGKEYGSVEEVPEEHRGTIRNALSAAKDTAGHDKFIVNGVEYDSLDAMPPEVRKPYEEAIGKAKRVTLSANINLQQPSGNLKPEGFLSARTVTILALLAGLAILLKFLAHK